MRAEKYVLRAFHLGFSHGFRISGLGCAGAHMLRILVFTVRNAPANVLCFAIVLISSFSSKVGSSDSSSF